MKNDSYISIDFTKTGKYVEVFYNPGGDDYDILLTAKMPKKKFDSMTTPDWKLDEYSVVAGYKKSDVKKFSDDANDAITQAYSEWNDTLKKMGVSMNTSSPSKMACILLKRVFCHVVLKMLLGCRIQKSVMSW